MRQPVRRRPTAWVLPLTVALTLVSGCTFGGDDTPPTGSSTGAGTRTDGASSPATSTSPAVWATPAWQQQATYPPAGDVPALVSLYPLQRVDGHLLLTVDVTPQGGSTADLNTMALFCPGTMCRTMGGISLIDAARRVRYGPLRQPSPRADLPYYGNPFGSFDKMLRKTGGTTYRFGAFFPDPGPEVSSLSVDLLFGGLAPDIPIVAGTEPAPDLVDTPEAVAATPSVGAPTPGASASPGSSSLVTLRVPRPTADAVVEKHDLMAKVAGGTVTDSGPGRHGVVTLNADVLFAFDSAALSPQAKNLITQASQLVAAKADPAKPVEITGYTDAKGSPGYNQTLSTKRAAAVAAALKAEAPTAGFSSTARGRGEADPVAPNTVPGGGDNPDGRALNRRVEIAYTPKPVPIPTPTPAATISAAPDAPATGPAGPTVTVGPKAVKGNGTFPVQMSATVYPVTIDGTLSLVRLDLTSHEDGFVIDAFSGRSKASLDLGAFHLIDPTTKATYIPAYDADAYTRVTGTTMWSMKKDNTFHFYFYTAALPETVSTATLSLGQLGSTTVSVHR
ncbi:MAG: OmpA family protein [Kineosporiaceae bacterium]|nr:OmpA family protein [Kineosporiaceae bacterium]MBK7622270.1 OmpA family protein [Kineosporiaceae bacterium]MBK8074598.1 OmpA family protein [Kineosporiaceae bacterium]